MAKRLVLADTETGEFSGVVKEALSASIAATIGAVFRDTQAEAEQASALYGVPGYWFVEGEITPPTEVTATAPTFNDASGTASDTYTIPVVAGVDYRVGGSIVAEGAHSATGVVTITATAQSGYALTGITSWSHTFSTNVTISVTGLDAAITADAPLYFIKNADVAGTIAPLDSGSAPLTLAVTGPVTYGAPSPWGDTTAATFASGGYIMSSGNTVPLASAFTMVAVFRSSLENATPHADHLVNLNVNGNFQAALISGQAMVGDTGTAISYPPLNTWIIQHAVFDGTTIFFYRNGVQVATIAKGLNTVNVGPLLIGVRGVALDRQFDGSMSRVAVFNTALSAARVLAHAQAGGFA